MRSELVYDQFLDVRGLNCPLPLLKMKQVLNAMLVGEVIHVITTDSGSERDFYSFSEQAGHKILHLEQVSEMGTDCEYRFWLEKGC